MVFNFDIINILVLLAAVANTLYGIVVFSRNRGDSVNRAFFVLTAAVSAWGLAMFAYRGGGGIEDKILFAKFLYFAASIIPISFLFFVYAFTGSIQGFSKNKTALTLLPFLVSIIFSVMPNALIKGVTLVEGAESIINFDLYMHVYYGIYIITYFCWGYFLLFKKFFTTTGTEKDQMSYIIIGTLVSTTIGVITNLIMPLFGVFTLNWLGQIGIVIMVISITYAILKHHLFNVKVIATELLVFSLWTAIFIRIFVPSSPEEKLYSVILLAVTTIVGALLIRNVYNEIAQREKIELLAKNLEAANKGQEDLIHILNHQIKGYLGKGKSIFSELLTDPAYNVCTDKAKEYLTEGLSSMSQGVDFVMSVLKGSSAYSGAIRYEMKDFDLKAIVEEVANFQKENAEKKQLTFDLVIEPGNYHIIGDAINMKEAIRNLFDNSINYTLYGGVRIHLQHQGGKILLSVIDTGIGILHEDMEKLFTRGGRGRDSQKINVNSTGFGLAFVKGVIEAHKGRVWAESAGPRKGSQFYVELPSDAKSA